jgi:glycosyltransferase involved in cell wall biosynthesis
MNADPLVSVVVETSNWNPAHPIQLWDTLAALERQSYPRDRFEVLVALDAPHHPEADEIRRRHPGMRVLPAPATLTYYELKNFGASQASGEIVAFTDADCLPSDVWVEEIARSFATAGPQVAAVQGRTRFADLALARAWEASWWSRGFEDEGPIDRMYTSNNIAFRSELYRRYHYLDGSDLRAGLERPLSRQLQRAGYGLWLNPRMLVRHNYSATLREIVQLGLVRGFNFMKLRRTHPEGIDFVLRRFGVLAPLICAPVVFVKDILRLFRKAPRLGIRASEFYKMPLYMLLQVPYNLLTLLGMYWAIMRPDRTPRRPL